MPNSVALDAFDLKLLAALQDNGQLSNQELANRINLSASQCSRRRIRLEEKGVLLGYRWRSTRRCSGSPSRCSPG